MKLSVVISAYNEELVIAETLEKICRYLDKRLKGTYEVVVSDDGSKDQTVEIVENVRQSLPQVRVLKNKHKGKGHGIYQGVKASQGDLILLCDADLATPIEEYERLQAKMEEGFEIVIASREGLKAQRIGEPFYRHLMGRIFNHLVKLVALRGINDTQCGFKLLKGDVAKEIFAKIRLYGEDAPELNVPAVTAYDVEMLYLAQKLGCKIAEVPTKWQYKPTVRISPLRDSWRNFKDILCVRLNDWWGLYR